MNLGELLYQNFIFEDRYMLFLQGMGNTVLISLLAVLFGVVLGILVALMRLSKLKIANGIATTYINIIRGTPVIVQVAFIYLVVFSSVDASKILVGVIAFGINSGAYVSEIIRAGIQSIDRGQTEAGRSLGLTSSQTMTRIIFPQAIKNILPALGNEFIVLIKETSVIGYFGLIDVYYAGRTITSKTYNFFLPILAVAIIYLIMVLLLTRGLRIIERRLRQSDSH